MQQTEKYQLNLIEMGDTFALDPLNENAQKTEAAIEAARAEAAAGDDALDQRVTALEIHKIAVGQYTGGSVQTFDVGFTPVMVLVVTASEITKSLALAVAGYPAKSGSNTTVLIKENGFTVYVSGHVNTDNNKYNYIALA